MTELSFMLPMKLFTAEQAAPVSPITNIDNRDLGDGKVGPVSKELQKLYFDVVKGRVSE